MGKTVYTLQIQIDYDTALVNLGDAVFRVVCVNDRFFLNGMSDSISIDHEIFLKNPTLSDIEFIKRTKNHFCRLISSNKSNQYMVLEMVLLNGLVHVENFSISTTIDKTFLKNFFATDSNGDSVMLSAVFEHQKDDVITLLSYKKRDQYLVIKVEKKFNKETGFEETFYVIDDKQRTFKKNKQTYQTSVIYGSINLEYKPKPTSTFNIVALEKFNNNTANYLSLWNMYNNMECELKFKEAKKLGFVNYKVIERYQGNLFKIFFDPEDFRKIKNFPDECFLGIGTNEILSVLDSGVVEPKEYLDQEMALLNGDEDSDPQMVLATMSRKDNKENYVLVYIKEASRILSKIEYGGYIICSLLGDMTVFKRRNAAKDAIWSGNCGMPNIFSFFGDDPIPSAPREKMEIDFSLVDKELTANQQEALSVICNTPDIAVIQGPPGTGKTTIIELAIKQINARMQASEKYANNLICAFRHETVNNLASKVNVYGIPTIKVGLDNRTPNPPKVEEVVSDYIDDLLNNLENKYSDLTYSNKEYEEFTNKINNYINFCSSIDESKEILEYMLNIPFVVKNEEWKRTATAILNKLNSFNRKLDFENSEFLKLLYRLPTSKEQYDDGSDDLLIDLEINSSRSESIKKDVDILLKLFEEDPISFEKVKYARKKLIIKYRPVPTLFIEKPIKAEISDLLEKIKDGYNVELFKGVNGTNKAIIDYMASLNENPLLLKRTLLEYSKVLGVTNQQSYSHYLADSLPGKDDMTFENVYIDEAATSSPLDLFLPISLAKSRLVLVGDHKQLPNIINEEIAEQIDNDMSSSERGKITAELKQTLFEHLFEKCKELEKKDGIRRVVTLNTQFRMHPVIGQIVSKHFYSEEGGIDSPRPASEFEHSFLGFKNQPLVWYDIPFVSDPNKIGRRNKSRFNTIEADLIAKKLKEAINRDDYNGESVGIITLYRPQVKELEKALQREGVLTGSYYDEVYNDKGQKVKLEVGTVDAFQGKEFDIVFLSTVYSFEPSQFERESYSRLTTKNLLCVALSRAIKCLIVVGNKDIYNNDKAVKVVPSLCEILRICEGDKYVIE